MGILDFIFHTEATANNKGICLDTTEGYWRIDAPIKIDNFFLALPSIVSDSDLLYCEGGVFEKEESLRLIEKLAVETELKIQSGTIWPAPRKYYVPTSKANLELLKMAAQNCLDIEFGVHFAVCNKEKVKLEWYDAATDIMLITKDFNEQAIENFSNLVRQKYRFVKVQ